ncbi:MAG: sensor histidine kinase [Haloarculaceae archaeon]
MARLVDELRAVTAAATSRAATTRVAVLGAAMATFAVGQLLAFPPADTAVDPTVVVAVLYLPVPLVGVFFVELLRGERRVYRPILVSIVTLGLYAVTDLLAAVVDQPAPFSFVFRDLGLLVATAALLVGLGRWTVSRNERERRLQAREAELKRNNERLEEFASVVSHDLRNPLQVADGRLALIEETGDLDHLADVQDALDRMETIIEDVLSLARTGEDTADPESVTVESVATAAWETVATEDAVLAVEEGRIVADPDLLQQVFENLFRNSVEHGSTSNRTTSDNAGEHGSTSNRTTSDNAGEHTGPAVHVRVGTLPDGFYVEDDGPGIPEDEREDVLETGYTTDREGTGFGLAIVTRIAKAHDWDVAVTDSEIVDVGVAPDGDTELPGARFEFTGVERV